MVPASAGFGITVRGSDRCWPLLSLRHWERLGVWVKLIWVLGVEVCGAARSIQTQALRVPPISSRLPSPPVPCGVFRLTSEVRSLG